MTNCKKVAATFAHLKIADELFRIQFFGALPEKRLRPDFPAEVGNGGKRASKAFGATR